jgi:hypothetical protein
LSTVNDESRLGCGRSGQQLYNDFIFFLRFRQWRRN